MGAGLGWATKNSVVIKNLSKENEIKIKQYHGSAEKGISEKKGDSVVSEKILVKVFNTVGIKEIQYNDAQKSENVKVVGALAILTRCLRCHKFQ